MNQNSELSNVTNAENTRRIPEVVKHLIEVGRSETFEVLRNLERRFPGLRSDRSTAEIDVSWYKIDWTFISCLIPDEDVICLVKSMTMLEHYPNFKAGSASPIFLVFRGSPQVGRREDLINWILRRTNNDYLPFGGVNLGAKSIDEYHELKRQELNRKLERARLVREEQAAEQAAEPKRRALERERRQAAERKRRVDLATQRLFGAIRRRDRKAISALVARGADSEARNQDGKSARTLAVEAGVAHLLDPL